MSDILCHCRGDKVCIFCGKDMTRPDNNWIGTFTGRKVWPLNPKPEQIFIEDIAHSLSQLCRYTGQCIDFYSVAEHCIHMSYNVPISLAFATLMHDSPEAYLNDISRPIKPGLTGYIEIEENLLRVIHERFNIKVTKKGNNKIKEMDGRILVDEVKRLMTWPGNWNFDGSNPLGIHIKCWSMKEAEEKFLHRFNQLFKGENSYVR